MSESAVQESSGPTLEQILWGAVERWSAQDVPAVSDREEFVRHIEEAWGGETPTEEFLSHFFGEDRSVAWGDAADMADAVVRATRDRMFVYEFDLNRLEYVVIEGDDDKMTVVGDMGQFQFQVDDTVRRLIENAVIPGSSSPIGSGGEFDRNKNPDQPKAYFVRSTGEMVAVDVVTITKAVQLAQRIQQVEAPVMDKPAWNLAPFNPRKTRVLTAEREARILRQDTRMRSTTPLDFLGTRSRDILRPPGEVAAASAAMLSMPPPGSADPTVFLLMPDGTLAQPTIGSGTRWRDMVSDWTARAAFISVGASVAPVSIINTEQRFVIEGTKVVAVFSGGQSSQGSASAPGAVGLAAEASSAGVMAARSQIAPVRVLSDEELARAVMSGAQLVSGLTANMAQADGRTTVGFWVQPEALFKPSIKDMDVVQRGPAGSIDQSTGDSELDKLVADARGPMDANGQPLQQLGKVTGDPWADWALQAGGKINPTEILLAARNRPKATPGAYGGAVGELAVPGGPGAAPAGQPAAGGGGGGTFNFPGSAIMAFRAPDGSIVSTRGLAVRLAQAGRPSAEAMGFDGSSSSSGSGSDFVQPSGGAAGGRLQIPIAGRSGAIPATALAALSMALERTAGAAGYKLPMVRLESATNALEVGDQLGLTLSPEALERTEVRQMGSMMLDGQTARLVVSMPFPNASEVHVGGDLADALQSYTMATAVPAPGVPGSTDGSSMGPGSVSGGSSGSGFMLGGAAAGALGGGALAFAMSRGPGGQLVVPGGVGAGAASGAASGGNWVIDPTGDYDGLHGQARGQAQQGLIQLQQPGVIELIGSSQQRAGTSRIGALPSLLQSALESTGGGWVAGPGAQVPGGVRQFVMQGPYDLPELAGEQQQQGVTAVAAPMGRPINPGEDEIEIPLPLWAQMGRGQLSATNRVLASARAQPGYAPPLGLYRLVTPAPMDFAPEGPNSLTVAGPTGMSFEAPSSPQSATGELVSTQARSLGGRFLLGRIPLADDAVTYESRSGRTRGRVGAPLSQSSQGSQNLDTGTTGSYTAPSDGDLPFGRSPNARLPSLGGDSPAGSLVSGSGGVPQVPRVDLPDLNGALQSSASTSSSSLSSVVEGAASPPRPMAGALQSALRFSDDIGNRALPQGAGITGASPASFSGALGGSGSSGMGSLVSGGGAGFGGGSPGALVSGSGARFTESSGAIGSSGLGSSGDFGSSGALGGDSYGSGSSNLASSAPRGDLVSSNSPTNQAIADVRRQTQESTDRLASSSGSGVSSSALTGADRQDPGYTQWNYGTTTQSNPVTIGSGVDVSSGLSKPNYPTLPSALRFRYVGAPLWWTGKPGAAGSDTDSDGGDESPNSGATRALRSGLKAANTASTIWRSILVAPRGEGATTGSSSGGGAMDHGWDASAEQMSGTSSRMSSLAVASGAVVGGAAAGAFAGKGAETVYVALDGSKGGTATASEAAQARAASINMQIVAAIPPAPPPVDSMGGGSSNAVEARPRGKHGAHHGHDQQEGAEGGQSHSKIEGSVDAVAQRIFHRIRARMMFDRERFNG